MNTTENKINPVEFALLKPEGPVEFVTADGDLGERIRQLVPDACPRQVRPMTLWDADTYTADMPYNAMTERIVGRGLGYWPGHRWSGPAAVSMGEARAGIIPTLTAEMRAQIEIWASVNTRESNWAPAEEFAPDVLAEEAVMWMMQVVVGGVTIEQYKNRRTKQYLNLDETGQAWRLRQAEGGLGVIVEKIDLTTAKAECCSMDGFAGRSPRDETTTLALQAQQEGGQA